MKNRPSSLLGLQRLDVFRQIMNTQLRNGGRSTSTVQGIEQGTPNRHLRITVRGNVCAEGQSGLNRTLWITDSSFLGQEVLLNNLSYTHALCSFDIRNNFVITYKYNLPIGDIFRRHDRLTDGWSLSGTTRLSTGLPITVPDSVDYSLLGTNPNGVNNNYIDRPNCSAGPLNLNHSKPNLPAFNTSLFTQETLGTLGDCPLASFSGPGFVNFDMALLKVVRIKESKALEFRWEAYNVFNSPQFFISANGNPSVQGNFTNPQFGQIVGAMNARIMQLGVKFLF